MTTPDTIPTEQIINGDLSAYPPSQIDATIAQLNAQSAQEEVIANRAAQLLVLAAAEEAGNARWRSASQIDVAKVQQDQHQAKTRFAVLRGLASRLNAEWRRRGFWERYYLVDNDNGHVHRNTQSGQCSRNWRTSYVWLTDYSGMPEAELIELAGHRTCTHCYPSAPVEVLRRPSALRTPSQQARDDAAAKRREKAAARAEKAITDPNGGALYITLSGYTERIKTAVAAERKAVELMVDARYSSRQLTTEEHTAVATLVAALAHKHNTTTDAVRRILDSKYQAKCKREGL